MQNNTESEHKICCTTRSEVFGLHLFLLAQWINDMQTSHPRIAYSDLFSETSITTTPFYCMAAFAPPTYLHVSKKKKSGLWDVNPRMEQYI